MDSFTVGRGKGKAGQVELANCRFVVRRGWDQRPAKRGGEAFEPKKVNKLPNQGHISGKEGDIQTGLMSGVRLCPNHQVSVIIEI